MDYRFLDLTELFRGKGELLQRLIMTPAMYLGSCRYKLPDSSSEASCI